MRIRCCDKVRKGKFCSECGRRLIHSRIKAYRKEINRLRNGIHYHIEVHRKKMAGSTIQYSIEDLKNLLENSPELDV